jgi:hypothetical protein
MRAVPGPYRKVDLPFKLKTISGGPWTMEGRSSALVASFDTRAGLGCLGLGVYFQSDQSKVGKFYTHPLLDPNASQMECIPTGVKTVNWRLSCTVRC